ncbi:MAG: tripartite tricarboxylate transporter TctB family protein [Deltaproteobacteria bacterium]|nr:tripartite tricarboxylate transporter TctB family protein [Deltaproteobacteria bacterium]
MRNTDRISALVLLAGAGFVGIEAWRLNIWSGPGVPGAGFLPFLLAIALVVGAIGVFLEGTLSGTGDTKWFADRESALRLAVLMCCIAALVAAIQPLGMLMAVGLFLLVFLAITLRGQWLAILFIAGATPVCLHLIFERWLKFTLPRGFLGF